MMYSKFGIYFVTESLLQKIRLPVNPSELTISYAGENSSYNLVGTGEVIIPRLPKLATVSISSFFPRNEYIPFSTEDSWYQASDYVNFFRSLLESKAVFLFIVNRYDDDKPMFDTSFKAILTSFSITDKGGETGDIYFEMSLSEYRDTKPEKVSVMKKDEESSTTYLVREPQRDVSSQEFVVGDKVTVNGPVYPVDDAEASIQMAIGTVGAVGRLLPPSKVPNLDRMYINGLGWVHKNDCMKSKAIQAVNKVQNFRTT